MQECLAINRIQLQYYTIWRAFSFWCHHFHNLFSLRVTMSVPINLLERYIYSSFTVAFLKIPPRISRTSLHDGSQSFLCYSVDGHRHKYGLSASYRSTYSRPCQYLKNLLTFPYVSPVFSSMLSNPMLCVRTEGHRTTRNVLLLPLVVFLCERNRQPYCRSKLEHLNKPSFANEGNLLQKLPIHRILSTSYLARTKFDPVQCNSLWTGISLLDLSCVSF